MAKAARHGHKAKAQGQLRPEQVPKTATLHRRKKPGSTDADRSPANLTSLKKDHDSIIEAAVFEEGEIDVNEDGPVTFDPVGRKQTSKPFQQNKIPLLDEIFNESVTFDGDIMSKRSVGTTDKRPVLAFLEPIDSPLRIDRHTDMRSLVMTINGDCSV